MESYILKSQIHFGSLKTSVPKGTVVRIDRDKNLAEFNDVRHENFNLHEIDMMVKAGYIIPYEDGKTKVDTTIKVSSRAKQQKKMEVRQSDSDMVTREIKPAAKKCARRQMDEEDMVSGTETGGIKVIREQLDDESARGMKVIKSDEPAVTEKPVEKMRLSSEVDDDMKVVKKIAGAKKSQVEEAEEKTMSETAELSAMVNGQQEQRVVKMIGKGDSTKPVDYGNKLTAKHAPSADAEAKAKATAEARKAQVAKRRAEAAAETSGAKKKKK